MTKYSLLIIIILYNTVLFSQEKSNDKFIIKGKVIDELSNPIEYSTVVLFNKKDSSFVIGTTTDKKGKFKLDKIKAGNYYLKCDFLGYKTYIISNISGQLEFETIKLKQIIQNLKEVEINAEKKHIEYKLDKKVINVSKDLISSGGTAVDVLENVPSIKTDLQGNVYLRGGGFTLLIDGKPTVMSSNDLKDIQASSIDKIEIITNPSVKYSPEGVSGIINIILKKNNVGKLNGAINLSIGTYDKYNFSGRLIYKIKKIRLITGIGYNNKFEYRNNIENRKIQDTNGLNIININQLTKNNSYGGNIKLGLDYLINDKTTFGFFVKYRQRNRKNNALSDIIDKKYNDTTYLNNNYIEKYGGEYYNLNINFNHDFKEKNHNIDAYTYFTKFNYQTLNLLTIDTTDNNFNTINYLSEISKRVETNQYFRNITKIDYSKPIGKKSLLETGYSYTFVDDNSINENLYFNNDLNTWSNISNLNNLFYYQKQIHSIYGIFKNNFKKFKFKLGIRFEYYRRITEQKTIADKYTLQKIDFFPSLHLQYDISENNKIQSSYSRRTNRFWGTQLNPFPILLDARNISKGNPKIQPEYINSFELNYLHYLNKSSYFSTEVYFRQTTDLLGDIQILQDNGIIIHTYENLNSDYTLGVELMLNYHFKKWWTTNFSFDYYKYELIGNVNNININNNIYSYDFRLQNTFKIKKTIKLQITGYYSGPTIYIQEVEDPFYRIGMAIRKSFYKRKLNLTIRIKDIFNTSKYSSTITGLRYEIDSKAILKYPLIYLQISYRFN